MAKLSGITATSITWQEASAPSTPAATKWVAYFKTDGLYYKDDAGAETGPLAAAGAGAPTNGEYVMYAANGSVSNERVVSTPASGGVIPFIVYKSADEIVNNSSALQDDNHLIFALAATGEWEFQVNLWYDAATAADIKVAFTIPASTTLYWSHTGADASLASHNDAFVTTASASTRDLGGNAVGTLRHARIVGYVRTTGTSGNLTMQWAQNTANASDATIKRGSAMKVWALA